MAEYNNDLALVVRYDGTKEAFNNEVLTNFDKYKNKVVFIYGATNNQSNSSNLLQAIWISDANGGRYLDTASFEYISKNLDRISTVKVGSTSLEANGASSLNMRAKKDGGIEISPSTTTGDAYIEFSVVGKADIDDNGKILIDQLPDFILGQVLFGGTITGVIDDTNIKIIASENLLKKLAALDKSLSSPDVGRYTINKDYADSLEGVYFIVGGEVTNVFGIDVEVGDWIISTGRTWVKIDNTDAVKSVAGLNGIIDAQELANKLSDSTLTLPLYRKPTGGIAFNDLSKEIQDLLKNAQNVIPSIAGDDKYITVENTNDGALINAITGTLAGAIDTLATTDDIRNYLNAVLSVKVVAPTTN